ncbi:hypothetical protein G3M53_71105, partial [Streptomyces sp. SID7982]|nr:hypothetical protein [Streptomyces sp. SID7982]
NYGICDSNEPPDPRAEGSFKDALGGAAEVGGATLDFLEYATEPWCWFGAKCGGAEDKVKEFEEKHGVDTDSKAHDSGEDFTEAATLFNIGGLIKKAAKEILGAARKKAKPDAPKAKEDNWDVPSKETADATWERLGFGTRNDFGKVAWGGNSKDAALKLRTPAQVGKMRDLGLTVDDSRTWRNFYA